MIVSLFIEVNSRFPSIDSATDVEKFKLTVFLTLMPNIINQIMKQVFAKGRLLSS